MFLIHFNRYNHIKAIVKHSILFRLYFIVRLKHSFINSGDFIKILSCFNVQKFFLIQF
jgi:hypothetical protein